VAPSKKSTKTIENTEATENVEIVDADDAQVSNAVTTEGAPLISDETPNDGDALRDDKASEETSEVPLDDTLTDDATLANTEDESSTAEVEPQAVTKKSGVIPLVLGGALCVGLGYAGANFLKPDGWPFPGASTAQLQQQVGALEAAIEGAQATSAQNAAFIEALRDEAQAANAKLKDTIEEMDVNAAVAPISEDLTALEKRLTALEAAPVTEAIVSPEATAAYERQLAEMQTLLTDEIERLQEAKTTAEATQQAAEKVTDMSRLQEAVNSGVPFGSLIDDLSIDVPEVVKVASAQGVTTLPQLAADFEDAADVAIVETAKSDTENQSWSTRFLRTQLGLRSLSPKEGSSPDAILSRAQQAVRDNDLSVALTEISTLPDVGQAVMATWVAKAQTRLDVTNALSAMLAQ
jgi:hypothetical protein